MSTLSHAGPSGQRSTSPLSPIFPSPPATSPNRPSLFELLAEDQLRDLLHPVVRYVLTVSENPVQHPPLSFCIVGALGQGALTTVLDPSVPSLPPARVESPRGVLRASTARTGATPSQET